MQIKTSTAMFLIFQVLLTDREIRHLTDTVSCLNTLQGANGYK